MNSRILKEATGRYIYIDENAQEISVEYTFDHSPGVATVYVYPAPTDRDNTALT